MPREVAPSLSKLLHVSQSCSSAPIVAPSHHKVAWTLKNLLRLFYDIGEGKRRCLFYRTAFNSFHPLYKRSKIKEGDQCDDAEGK